MVEIGDRIKLLKTNDPYHIRFLTNTDLEKNEYIGTVYDINHVSFDGGFTQIWCKFDNGSNFAIVPECDDIYEVIK
jgi:hypothetical protein